MHFSTTGEILYLTFSCSPHAPSKFFLKVNVVFKIGTWSPHKLFNSLQRLMPISIWRNSIRDVDGQHRLYGLRALEEFIGDVTDGLCRQFIVTESDTIEWLDRIWIVHRSYYCWQHLISVIVDCSSRSWTSSLPIRFLPRVENHWPFRYDSNQTPMIIHLEFLQTDLHDQIY